MTVLRAFRLPASLAKRLARFAKATHRSERFYVAAALQYYFENYMDAQIAKDRFQDPNSKVISGAELRARLGL
jgi:predicted DNA-binding protein